MFTLVKHPDNWLQNAQTHQVNVMRQVPQSPSDTLILNREALAHQDTHSWALLRVTDGLVGIGLQGNRLVALEAGDCWLGHPGGLAHWFQEGAVSLEVWHWQDVSSSFIPTLISGFNDCLLALLNYSAQMPQDPAPGFEFFNAGEVIIREDEVADCVYTLIQGRAKVVRDGVQLGIAREGEILGLQAMLLNSRRTATVIAEGNCSAVRVAYDKFQNLIASRPELVVSTLETMARQVERMNQRLLQDQDDSDNS